MSNRYRFFLFSFPDIRKTDLSCFCGRGDNNNNDSDNDNNKNTTTTKKRYCLPSAIILGQHKSGTTSLSTALRARPQIYFMKEAHFFTSSKKKTLSFALVVEKKGSARQLENKIMVEDSADYFSYGIHLPEIFYHLNPTTKFFILLRHPIERLISSLFFYSDLCSSSHKNPILHTTPEEIHDIFVSQINHLNECRNQPPPPHTTTFSSSSSSNLFSNLSSSSSSSSSSIPYPSSPTTPGLLFCLQKEQLGMKHCEGRKERFYRHLSDSLYSSFLIRWLSVFPKENFFLSDVKAVKMTKIYEFLEINPRGGPQNLPITRKKRESAPYFDLLPKTIELLHDFYNPLSVN